MQVIDPAGAPQQELEASSWPGLLEDQLEVDLKELRAHPAAARRRPIAGLLRLIALVVAGLGVLGAIQVAGSQGIGLGVVGLVGVWVLPMVVLAVVLGVEKLLLRITH